jgi:hypothetical protein
MISQEDMKIIILPLLRDEGKIFIKNKNIWARKAEAGEIIITVTNDGLETSNIANQGDMLVRNQTDAKEIYVMSKDSFAERYRKTKKSVSNEIDFEEFTPIGKIYALCIDKQLLTKINLDSPFYFEAPWNANMICKENDYLACPPDFSQVYRIARKEFFETYTLL